MAGWRPASGSRPSERSARHFGISRPTVRGDPLPAGDAHPGESPWRGDVRRFVERGGASRAAAVRPLAGRRRLEHLFEVRLLLEPGAAALAAERATPDEVGDLRDCAARAEKAVDDPDAMLRLDSSTSGSSGEPASRAPVGGHHRAGGGGAPTRKAARSSRRDDRRARGDRRGDRDRRRADAARGWPRTSTASGTQRWRRLRRAARRPERPDPRVARSRRGLAGSVPSCAAGTGPRGRCAER